MFYQIIHTNDSYCVTTIPPCPSSYLLCVLSICGLLTYFNIFTWGPEIINSMMMLLQNYLDRLARPPDLAGYGTVRPLVFLSSSLINCYINVNVCSQLGQLICLLGS